MYALAVFGYCVVVVLANYFTDTFLPLPLGGLLSVGTLFFGATFTLRDYVHHYGRRRVYLMIVIAALVNVIAAWWLGTPARFIVASFITIIIAEAADTEVYQALLKRPWMTRVAASNGVSVPLDSILFTLIAFAGQMSFLQMAQIVWGDIIFKYLIGIVIAGWRWVRPRDEMTQMTG